MIGSTIVSSTEDGLDKLARHARGVLIALAALQVVATGVLYAAGSLSTTIDLALGFGLGGVFAGLAVWARRNPLPAVSTGFGIWGVLMLLAAIDDPSTLWSGWLVKGLIIAAFANGISTARTYEEMKREQQKQPIRARG